MASKIVDEAGSWLNTPYHWRARVKGVGADCGTFVWSVMNHFYEMPPMPREYDQSWVVDGGANYFIDTLEQMADELPDCAQGPGDITVFKTGRVYGHCAIVLATGRIIHCYGRKGIGGVVVSPAAMFRHQRRRHFRIKDEYLRHG